MQFNPWAKDPWDFSHEMLKIKGGVLMPFQAKYGKAFAFPSDVDVKFSRGLNVIVGPNGSGKSTMLRILESFMMIGDRHVIETNGGFVIRDFFKEERWGHYSDTSAFDVYADYTNKAFRMPEMSDIDRLFVGGGTMYDFALAKAYCSKGESAEVVLEKLFARIKEQASAFDFQKYYNYSLDTRDHPYIAAHRIPDEGITTVLIDEPDSHLDIFKVKSLAGVLTEDRPGMQLIVVVHNPLLICELAKSGKANFIEMEDGYVGKVRNAVREMAE